MQQISRYAGVVPQVMRRYKRELIWIASALALSLPLGYAAQVRAAAAADARQGVILSAAGPVTVGRVQVMAEVPGVVREVPEKGAQITKGQQLARLEDLDLEAAVVSARLELQATRASLAKAQAPAKTAELSELDDAIELATIALEAAQKATDSLHAGINASSGARQDAQAALNQEVKSIQAKAGQTAVPHHATAGAGQATGIHGEMAAQPAQVVQAVPPASEDDDCEVHQQLRELVRLFETVTVRVAAADQPISAARDNSLMEQLMAQVDTARINLKQAVDRKVRLTAAPPPEDGLEAHAKVQQAQTALTLAERKLQKATVTAPVTGAVLEVPVSPGTPVNIGQPLVVLSNDANTFITLRVRAKSAALVQPGQKATVTVGESNLIGKVSTVDRDPNGGLTTIKVILEKLEQRIPDGASAQVKVIADSLTAQ